MDQEDSANQALSPGLSKTRAVFKRLARDKSTATGIATVLAASLIFLAAFANIGSAKGNAPQGKRLSDPVADQEKWGWYDHSGGNAPSIQPAVVAPHGGWQFVPGAPAIPLVYRGTSVSRDRALDCLSMAAWYEAGNDTAGQKAVMQVILNRLRHPAFPKSVCGVVFQGAQLSTGCQFTFTCDGSRARRKPSAKALDAARRIAELALKGAIDSTVGAATHYHADFVQPWWSHRLNPVSKVGAHIFYSWKGAFGNLPKRDPGAMVEPEIPVFDPSRLAELKADALPASAVPLSASATGEAVLAAAVVPTAPAVKAPRFMTVGAGEANGRWAVQAMRRCSTVKDCVVLAFPGESEAARYSPEGLSRSVRPMFLFVRDEASGMEIALWDCDRVQRPDQAQCMPANGPALDRLMRPR